MVKSISREETLKVKSTDRGRFKFAKNRWDSLAKPIGGLGEIENLISKIYAIKGDVLIENPSLLVFCADNHVVREGVAQAKSSVTKNVADRFFFNKTVSSIMAKEIGASVYPLDVGVIGDTKIPKDKTLNGAYNISKTSAMSEFDFEQAFLAGMKLAKKATKKSGSIILLGEMGIGNTTPATAVISTLLNIGVGEIVGRGAGLSDDGLNRKKA